MEKENKEQQNNYDELKELFLEHDRQLSFYKAVIGSDDELQQLFLERAKEGIIFMQSPLQIESQKKIINYHEGTEGDNENDN